jgi:hypothetical protein
MSDVFAGAVYALCFLTSGACAYLLARSYARTRVRLLLWSALCFLFLALNNLAVIVDLVILPAVSFREFRASLSLAAVGLLLYGLIWDRGESR